jgi:RimJ/RimL family protein N-acetyltransferase
MDELYSPAPPVDLHTIPTLQKIDIRKSVKIRPLDLSDTVHILEIIKADNSIRNRVSVAARLHTPEDVSNEVENYSKDPHLIRYAILENNNTVGLVSFWRDVGNAQIDAPDNLDDYGVGYFLAPNARGKGLVTNTIQCLINIAAKNLYVRQFIAYCDDNNHESIKVLNKLRFIATNETFTELNNGWIERKYVRQPT